jgi:ABC-type transport system substrate-binding protein
MSRPLPLALVQAPGRRPDDLKGFAESVASVARAYPQSRLIVYPELHLCGDDLDPAQAEQQLDRAGWKRPDPAGVRQKDGQPLSLNLWSAPAPFRQPLMNQLKEQLARVGVQLNVTLYPSSQLFETPPTTPQALAARQFDIAQFAWVSGYDPGPDQLYSLHSASIPTRANGFRGGNYGDYRAGRSDQLIDQLQRSLEPEFRANALAEAQAIWQNDVPIIPLLLRPITTATAAGLANFKPTPAPAGETWNVEQWDFLQSPPAS